MVEYKQVFQFIFFIVYKVFDTNPHRFYFPAVSFLFSVILF